MAITPSSPTPSSLLTSHSHSHSHPHSHSHVHVHPSPSKPIPPGTPKITLHPCTKTDLPTIALLEHLAFEHDEFSDLAFGKDRGTKPALQMREKQFEKFLEKVHSGEGEGWYCKACLDGEMVGVAGWSLGGGKEEKKEEMNGGKGPLAGEDEVKSKEKLEEIWGKGCNAKLCEDVFVRGDEYMRGACGDRPWLSMCLIFLAFFFTFSFLPSRFRSTFYSIPSILSLVQDPPSPQLSSHPLTNLTPIELNILVIHPSHQRRGIGTLLLEQGLSFADQKGLQTVLGASPWGIGLYRKYGFVPVHSQDIRLWEYEGGEGMGETRHVIMRRGVGGR